MKRNNDELLIEAIESSGVLNEENINPDLSDNCELPYEKQVSYILARELLKFRPDLSKPVEKDILFIVETTNAWGERCFSLPMKSLGECLEKKPFDDSSIWSYSLSEQKLIKELYYGDGIIWRKRT